MSVVKFLSGANISPMLAAEEILILSVGIFYLDEAYEGYYT